METTSTAVAPAQPQAPARVPVQFGSKGIIISDMDGLWRFATAVAKSGLAPKGIQTPEAIFVTVQMGLEVGLSPMAALQNIAPINGRPSVFGDVQLGLVRGSGYLLRFEEAETNNTTDILFRELCLVEDEAKKKTLRIQIAKAQAAHVKTADDFGVTVFIQRVGYEPIFSRFTVSDAKQAKLWGKAGPWSEYPARMLKFRARSFGLRDQFGDVLKGILSAEEAGDIPPEKDITPRAAKQKLFQPAVVTVEESEKQPVEDDPEKTPKAAPSEAQKEEAAKIASAILGTQPVASGKNFIKGIRGLMAMGGIEESEVVGFLVAVGKVKDETLTTLEEINHAAQSALDWAFENWSSEVEPAILKARQG